MDIFDIVLRLQVHNFTRQGGAIFLENAAPSRADCQRRRVMGIGHIARQVDVAACDVGA